MEELRLSYEGGFSLVSFSLLNLLLDSSAACHRNQASFHRTSVLSPDTVTTKAIKKHIHIADTYYVSTTRSTAIKGIRLKDV